MLKRKETIEDICRRFYELRVEAVSEEGTGGGSGAACVMGVLDAYRSVWSPRAFSKAVLRDFVSGTGFISDGHDWTNDIATLDRADIKGNKLDIAWTYYSVGRAQETRTKVKERKDRGKAVGLSISARPNWDKCADFDSGDKLWTYAEGLGEDMSLYDPAIRKFKGYCWIIPEVTRLYETAITLAPAVPGSEVTEARSLYDVLRDGSLGELSFGDHLDKVLGALEGIEARALEIEEIRAANTGRIGRDNLARLTALRDSLTGLIGRSMTTPAHADELSKRVEDLMIQRRISALVR